MTDALDPIDMIISEHEDGLKPHELANLKMLAEIAHALFAIAFSVEEIKDLAEKCAAEDDGMIH